MSQAQIYKYMKLHPNKWFINKEFRTKFNISESSVNTNLRKLIKDDFITYRKRIDTLKQLEYKVL